MTNDTTISSHLLRSLARSLRLYTGRPRVSSEFHDALIHAAQALDGLARFF